MVTARDILQIWSHRLNMNHEGVTQWTPSLRRAIETLVENLRAVEPVESVELDVDPSRIPIAKFIIKVRLEKSSAKSIIIREMPQTPANMTKPDN